ncbi:uncharacterized protein LOC131431104 [Malaya genurostris]|uniref:uncharacterized protein LOC131431104 n=1 Tax=Malaya genurostris TaxID=325434 RepID=UPI0026F3A1EC|nr:uncharacterized protein LOC131431104 [Malaya genurostris]XP_058452587.1 uncharacterized protein LOC131431104 [Malaya genurostris]
MSQNSKHPATRQSNEGSKPAAVMPTGSPYYSPEQYFQQQFPSGQQPQQHPAYSINPGFPPNMQMINHQSPAMSVSSPGQMTAVPQSPQPGAYPSFGAAGQYFVDAACTVPVGQQQPQPLNQFPVGRANQPGGCTNPNCTHCGKSTGFPSQRR